MGRRDRGQSGGRCLLIVGIFMDMTPAVLIFTPIFLPIAEDLGMNPVHFGIMMVANLCIGLLTGNQRGFSAPLALN